MGEMRVLTATDRNVLHRADSGALRFQVKVPLPGLGPALTFTAKDKPYVELYKIIIARQTKIINMTVEDREVTVFPLSSMDFGEFQGFWVTWFNRKIRMGLKNEQKPFLVFPIKTDFEIGYILFNTMSRNWAPVEWIIETSPVILKTLPFKEFEDKVRWVPMEDGRLPPDAMIGGFESEPIYIARAKHNNSLCPGKYTPSTGLAYVPWGHREHIKREFEILCGYNAEWFKTNTNRMPTNAFIGGRSEVQSEPLYIGRAMHDGKLLVGKVHLRYKTCYVPYNGKELESTTYEVLVIPQKAIAQAVPL